MKKKIRVLQGGQGASKTFNILLKIIDQCISRENSSCTVFQFELAKMKRTVILDFKNIMKSTDNWTQSEWNETTSKYNFRNGSYVEFVGLQYSDIGKGFRRDIVYFNEANNGISFESYNQVSTRAKLIFLDFNPDREFWVHSEVLTDHNAEYLQLTFQDNEALSESERQSILDYKEKGFIDPILDNYDFKENIKNNYWANKWRVYGLGDTGTLEGQIYKWQVIQEIPKQAELISYGLDFGFNDPTVLVEMYKYGFGYIINERVYRSGLDPESTRQLLLSLNLNQKIEIKADGSRPELIKMLQNARFNINAVDKANKNDRILLLSAENIQVTASSINIIREKNNYVWKKSNDGNNKDVPIDFDDHTMDAALYSADKVIIRMKSKIRYRSYTHA